VGGEIFRNCPDWPWGPPRLLYNRYRVFPGYKERPGRDADPSPPSSAVGHERVKLYLYSPYGPYGLCRASMSVQGCTLHTLIAKDAGRSKAWVCSRSLDRNVGSNPARGMDICLLWVLCVGR